MIHNKLLLAGEMLVAASNSYKAASTDIDYIKCILLAGAVINISYPLIEELGGKSKQRSSAELATFLMERSGHVFEGKQKAKQISRFIGFSNFAYNSLKHTGDKTKDVLPSDDLYFESNLKIEAERIIIDAISDFIGVPFSQSLINTHFSDELLDLLSSNWPS